MLKLDTFNKYLVCSDFRVSMQLFLLLLLEVPRSLLKTGAEQVARLRQRRRTRDRSSCLIGEKSSGCGKWCP